MKWRRVALTDICRPRQWKTIPTSVLTETGYPVFGANGIIGFYPEYNHEKPTVVITCRGATCGTVGITLPKSYITGNAMALDELDEDQVDQKFLYYQLSRRGFRDVISGTAQPQITGQGLSIVKIDLPPLPEQKRIAAILDKADAIRRKREKAIELTDSFLRSVFLEMFGDLSNGTQKCPVVLLGDVCNRITDGTHQSPKWASSGVPFLFVSNVVKGQLTYSTDKFISEETFHTLTKRCPIETGDVLYTTVGSYGNAALVGANTRFCFQRHIAHLKPNSEKINSRFLHVMLGTPSVRQQADSQARGVAQKTLNLSQLKEFKVLLPSMAEQQSFALIAEKVDSLIEKVNRSYFFLSSLSGSLQNELFQTKRCSTQGELHLTSLKEVAHAL